MAAGKLGDEKQELPEHELVDAKNRGDLRKVTAKVFEIFCITKQTFKKNTKTWSNKTDGKLIMETVLEDTGMLANFWKAVLEDTGMLANFSKLKSNTNYADNEITKIWKTSFICT